MSDYNIPYGKKSLRFSLPDSANVDVIAPQGVLSAQNPDKLIVSALQASHLDSFANAESVAIAINDKTRPVPHDQLLPPLLEVLEAMGIAKDAITLIIATGAHPPMLAAEFSQVVPAEVLSCYRVISHDCDDAANLVPLGETKRGTPVSINRTYAEADLRIVVGNVEPHQFQGFSGGVKSAAIGLAGRGTIEANHAWMTDPQSRLGAFESNPTRQDVEEIGAIIGIHFALNVILNDKKDILRVFAGDPTDVITAAIPLVREIYQVEVDHLYDLMIVSPGGHPKDINLYQAQKALAHAALVTRPEGTIILAAACPQGAGEERFEDWMLDTTSLDAILERFRQEGFCLGPHKAYQIARDVRGRSFFLLSEMPISYLERLHLVPVTDLQSLLQTERPAKEHIAVMPYANATIPQTKDSTSP
jgi:nickel-dependent lactate racemase